MPELIDQLRLTFGYDTFRPLQREIIEAHLAYRDTFALLPTGGGKSLCFQLPTIMRSTGLTIVVSPLIALMKDQVDQLQEAGVAATYLNSSLSSAEARTRLAGLHRGEWRLLYVAPERLMLDQWVENLKAWNVTAIAIDEAHCVSEYPTTKSGNLFSIAHWIRATESLPQLLKIIFIAHFLIVNYRQIFD